MLAAGGKLAAGKTSFKQRYEEAERRRAAILERLAGLNNAARAHPAYRRALGLPLLIIGFGGIYAVRRGRRHDPHHIDERSR